MELLREGGEAPVGGRPCDAAEKVWVAVWHATLALAEKYTGSTRPPEGVTWRELVESASMGAGLGEWEAAERGRPRTG
ncbi:MAG: hypothetical protein QXV98_03235 [Thermofilaceae archaeon]